MYNNKNSTTQIVNFMFFIVLLNFALLHHELYNCVLRFPVQYLKQYGSSMGGSISVVWLFHGSFMAIPYQ